MFPDVQRYLRFVVCPKVPDIPPPHDIEAAVFDFSTLKGLAPMPPLKPYENIVFVIVYPLCIVFVSGTPPLVPF